MIPVPETPYLLLNRSKMLANAERMRQHLAQLNTPSGIALRPHVKTAKCVQVARASLGQDTGPITVSTLKEADNFAAAGFTDILYAVGIVPNKLDHAIGLIDKGVHLRLLTDNLTVAAAIAQKARDSRRTLPTLIEIDTDGHRSGVQPDNHDLLIAIGHALDGQLDGVMTHAGESYNCFGEQALIAMAEQERSGIVHAADTLRGAGLPCNVVSLGSTPTALFTRNLDGITEVRAGVYIFQDLVMAGIGVCQTSEIALSVACTVIGHQTEKGIVLTDAGWMAMSRDRGTARQAQDQGYGLVCDERGNLLTDLIVADANQEHGMIKHRHGKILTELDFPVGTLLRILPNHACSTAAQFDGYHVLDSCNITDYWPRFRGW